MEFPEKGGRPTPTTEHRTLTSDSARLFSKWTMKNPIL